MKMYYYDGHYTDSEKNLEELEMEFEELENQNKHLTEWEDVD